MKKSQKMKDAEEKLAQVKKEIADLNAQIKQSDELADEKQQARLQELAREEVRAEFAIEAAKTEQAALAAAETQKDEAKKAQEERILNFEKQRNAFAEKHAKELLQDPYKRFAFQEESGKLFNAETGSPEALAAFTEARWEELMTAAMKRVNKADISDVPPAAEGGKTLNAEDAPGNLDSQKLLAKSLDATMSSIKSGAAGIDIGKMNLAFSRLGDKDFWHAAGAEVKRIEGESMEDTNAAAAQNAEEELAAAAA